MNLKVISFNGDSTDKVELSDKIFSVKPNKTIIKIVIDWQISFMKSRTAKTKQRNEITGSTAKIYAQKGTGGARHSSRKAPLFRGGGIAHGPKGDMQKVKKINKQVKKLGLINALSEKNHDKNLIVISDFKNKVNKTKEFNNFLNKNNISNALLVSDENSKVNIERSVRNIPNIKMIDQNGANVYDIIKYKHLVFTKSSIKLLEERLTK